VTAAGLLKNCSAKEVQSVVNAVKNFQVANISKNYDTAKVKTETITGDPAEITLSVNDLAVLQYAMVLEGLEYTFYKQVKANFSETKFIAAGFPRGTYTYLTVIAAHEQAHYEFLQGALGANATVACDFYKWSENQTLTPQQVIALANLFETTGVSAYDGAIDAISTPAYASAAATIATIEARHSSYLRSLTAYLPGNGTATPLLTAKVAFDITLSPEDVVKAVSPFLVWCTKPNNLPKYLPASRLRLVKRKHARRLGAPWESGNV